MIATHQRSPLEAGAAVPSGWRVPAVPPMAEEPAAGWAPAIEDCGEPLVRLDDRVTCLHLYAVDGWPGTVTGTWARAGVADRLVFAQSLLPDGFGLAVFDAWRSLTTQRALYDRFYGPGSTLPPGYVSDPNDAEVPPPHCTGGAVDLTLTWEGQALALGTAFDDFTPRAGAHALEGDAPAAGGHPDRRAHPDEPDRSLRRLLHAVLAAAGFVGLASEWWHVSFGDQRWAWHHRLPHARYGPTAPPAAG